MPTAPMSTPNWRLQRWQHRRRRSTLRQLAPFGLMAALLLIAVWVIKAHHFGR